MRAFFSWFRKEETYRVSLFDLDTFFVLVVTCFWYFTAYLLNPAMPSPDHIGWWGFFDQGHYYQTTKDLAQGHLLPSTYPYGYPLLGAPFYGLLPLHPYLIPNLILVLVLVGSFFAAARLFMSRFEAWILLILAILADSILRDNCLVTPWTTLPEYATFYLCFYLLIFTRATLPRCALCAAMCGLSIFARPSEGEILAFVYLCSLFDFSGWPRRLCAAAFLAVAYGLVVAFTFGSNFYFYNQVLSPYMQGQSGNFSASHYGLRIYQFLFDGDFLTGRDGPLHPPTHQLVETYWPFVFILPGAVFLFQTYRWKALAILLGIPATIAFFLLYNPVNNVPYFWSYGSFHYIWWLVPWLGLVTYLSFRCAPFTLKRPVYLFMLLTPLALICFLGVKDVVLASTVDSAKAQLKMETNYQTGSGTLLFTASSELDAVDLRIFFRKAPSFGGTDCSQVRNMSVWVGDKQLRDQWDYMTSQSDSRFDFSFIEHGLHLRPGDQLKIQFLNAGPFVIDHVDAIGATYAPFEAIRHFAISDLGLGRR